MSARCPFCDVAVEFDSEFTNFDDQGDFIVASATYGCECGETMMVRAYFTWDGTLEVD